MTCQSIPCCQAPDPALYETLLLVKQENDRVLALRYNGQEAAVEKAHATDYCGKGAIIISTPNSGNIAVVPITCKSWRCPKCGPKLARLWANRIAGAKPERFITLTGDPKLHATPQAMYVAMKAALPLFVRAIRKEGIKFEYVGVWEEHESGFPHIHLCQKGNYVPAAFMSALWADLGIGSHVHIRHVDDSRLAAFYAAKYMSKAVASLKGQLHITRTMQVSRNFFERSLFPQHIKRQGVCATIRTRRHVASVVEDLVKYHRFMIAEPPQGGAFSLTPPKGMSITEALELLSRVV